jgi:membrane fusion protein, multidrug efflux system
MRLKPAHAIAAGLVLALTGWLLSGQLGGGTQPPRSGTDGASEATPRELPAVRIRSVVAEPITREIVINGKTAPARTVTLRAETSGRVIGLGSERGALVAAGELLVRLDPRERRAMVDQARASLAMREIEHDAAQKLGRKGFQAETKVAEAKANLEAAQAALEHSQIELAHTEIEAPFDGVLEERPVEIGDFVDIGDPVATVIEQDPFLVTGEIAETEIARLRPGMAGSARLVTGQTVEGRLRYVGSRADPGTRTFRVELEVPNPSGRFVAGVSAELRIAYDRVAAHRISPGLLTLNDEGEVGVKAVDADDVVVFHPATVVRAGPDAVWLADLPERLRLITVGQGFVRAGDRVRPVPEAAIDERRAGRAETPS